MESVQDLRHKFEQAKTHKNAFVADWFLNVAFFSGYQWTRWAGDRLTRVATESRRELQVDNRILPVVTSRSAKKVKQRPTFVVTPLSGDDSDVEAARIGGRVLEADWLSLHLKPKLFEAVLWSDVCGDGFWKVFWDPTLGEKETFLYDNAGQPIMGPDGTPVRASEMDSLPPEVLMAGVQERSIGQGDVRVEVVSPFEFFPDPLATSMEDCEWRFEEHVRSLEYVKRHYPYDVDGQPFTPTPDANVPTGLTLGRLTPEGLFGTDTASYEGVKVYEYWCDPCSMYPDGHHAVYANDTMLVRETPVDSDPYVRFSSTLVPGQFWSRSVTSQLRQPQIQLNMLMTQIAENAKRFGNPAFLKNRYTNVEYHGVPGEIIEFDGTVPDAVPGYLDPPVLPQYIENQIERVEKSIEEISGMHEVSRATVPNGVTAASAINLLQEADDTRLAPEIHAMEFALGGAGTKVLKLRAEFNTDERTLKIAGDDGNWDIMAFKGAMLGEDPQVDVQAGSAMPQSQAAKQAAGMEVLSLIAQYQMPVDRRDLRRFLKNLEVGGLDALFEGLSEDERQVAREHRQMIEGQQIGINPWDDDKFHVDGHTEFQKTARYASLPMPVRQFIDQHVNEHRARMVGIVNKQLQAQAQEQFAAGQQQIEQNVEQAAAESEIQAAEAIEIDENTGDPNVGSSSS